MAMSRTRVATNRAGDWQRPILALFAAAQSCPIQCFYIGLRVELRDWNVFNEDAMKISCKEVHSQTSPLLVE
jgi:hypothetical protein